MQIGKAFFYICVVAMPFIAVPAVAAGGDALENYREQFRTYRTARESFELAREKYIKLGTLAARDDAFSATQNFLKSGTTVLVDYLELLRTKIAEHPNVPESLGNLANSLIIEDKTVYSSLQGDVEESTTLQQLEVISEDMQTAYEEKEAHAQFLNAVLIISDLRGIHSKLSLTAAEVKLTVEGDDIYPGRERILGEWYEKITNKLEESNRILEEAANMLQDLEEEEDADDKERLVEDTLADVADARDLKVQVASHLLEIVRAKKY